MFAAILLLIALAVLIAGPAFRTASPYLGARSANSCPANGRGLGLKLLKGFTPIRKSAPEDTFGTIFHSELGTHYKARDPAGRNTSKLIRTLREMHTAGIKTVVYSMAWEYGEPEEGKVRFEYLDWLANTTCANSPLKVDLIVDLLTAPEWLKARHKLYPPVDADGRSYAHRISWFHPPASEAALRFLSAVASYLSRQYAGCALAIQPVYNNEYEAKYTQEYDAYQDYSTYALDTYREWLRARSTDLALFNTRWGTAFKGWEEVVPPKLHSGDYHGLDFSSRYWDFLKFREEVGADVFNRACAFVKATGLKCFHHFPEFFTVLDAMYGASMFKKIAASPYTDFLIMDSNFRTPYRTLMKPSKLRVYVGAAQSYGKPFYFEAAVERYADMKLLEAGFREGLLSGAANLGITNWHGKVEMNSSLHAAMRPGPDALSACGPCELVGLFLHLDSCSAFHGLQRSWDRLDPLHDFVEEIADRLSSNCGTDIAVYIELDRFLADIPKLSRAVFVEPLVLYDSREFASYLAVKSALEKLPHEVLTLPANTTSGPLLTVFQDLPRPAHHSHKKARDGARAAAGAPPVAAAAGTGGVPPPGAQEAGTPAAAGTPVAAAGAAAAGAAVAAGATGNTTTGAAVSGR